MKQPRYSRVNQPGQMLKIIVSLLEIIVIKQECESDARSTLFSD